MTYDAVKARILPPLAASASTPPTLSIRITTASLPVQPILLGLAAPELLAMIVSTPFVEV